LEQLKNVKRQEDRERRKRLSKKLGYIKWGLGISFVVFAITGAMVLFGSNNHSNTNLEHTHGMGFSSDGKRLLIADHDGLRAYEQGRWVIPEGAKHDYMGFSPVNDGFYSSGHPDPGSSLNNPFGIVKSTDEGKALKSLALDGETDFHNMAVGFASHAIYVLNPQPNSKMDSEGLYYSTDEGSTWTKSEMSGVQEEPIVMAAHPSEPSIVAVGTPAAVYLSKDFGNQFEKIVSDGQITSLYFNQQGELFVGGYQNKAFLQKVDLANNQSEKLTIPVPTDDAVAYLAQNPVHENQLALATFKNSVFVSDDKGSNWIMVADKGKTISAEE
jgi:hypothetical protein